MDRDPVAVPGGVGLKTTEILNDACRWGIIRTLRLTGRLLQLPHYWRMVAFRRRQRRLRRRYGIESATPLRAWDAELAERLKAEAGAGAALAWTSGSLGTPRRIPYSRARLRGVRHCFQETFFRATAALKIRRAGFYIFASLNPDRSLTGRLLTEQRIPSRLLTLQAPYRLHSHPALMKLTSEYGSNAVRLLVLTVADPAVIYATNPSTLLVFLESLRRDWPRSAALARQLVSNPDDLAPVVHRLLRRVASKGWRERLRLVATADRPLSIQVWAPRVEAYSCWTGGNTRGFLQRLTTHLPADRYRLIPMFSMSTETVETVSHFTSDRTLFLPLAPGVLYEFLRADDPAEAERLQTPDQLEAGSRYELVVSDKYGLRRYRTGDLFEVRGFAGALPDLHFFGRRGLAYSFAGEKLTGDQLDDVCTRLRQALPALSDADALTCLPSFPEGDSIPHYRLVVVGGEAPAATTAPEVCRRADSRLKRLNGEYLQKREGGRLAAPRMSHVSLSSFLGALAEDQWQSQFKFLPLYPRTWEEVGLESSGADPAARQGNTSS